MIHNLGTAIRDKRNQLKMTGTTFAALISIDAGALNKVENGKALVSKKALPGLARLMEMTLEDLKDEWCSEKMAREIFKGGYTDNAHLAIAEKLKFIRQKNLTQGNLDL